MQLQVEDGLIRTQLCLALVAVVSHSSTPSIWDGRNALHWFLSQINPAGGESAKNATVEFLKILPQEAFSPSSCLRPGRRREFYKEVIMSSVEAVQILAQYCAGSSSAKEVEKLLEAYASWLKVNQGITIDISLISDHPLTKAALQGLEDNCLFDSAVACTIELIWYCKPDSDGRISEEHRPLTTRVIAAVVSLHPLLKSISAHIAGVDNSADVDEEVLKGVASLFAELGEAFMPLVVTGTPEVIPLMDALIDVAAHPNNTVCAMSFQFWQVLSEELLADQSRYQQAQLEFFKPVFSKLVQYLCLCVIEPEDFEAWRPDQKSEFKFGCESVAETLHAAGLILGGDTVIALVASPFQEVANAIERGVSYEWRNAQAIMYCIQWMSYCSPSATNATFASILNLALLLDKPNSMAYTSTMLIASYADWIALALESKLPGVPQPAYIMEKLSERLNNQHVAGAASLAIRHMCKACATELGTFLDALLHLLRQTLCFVDSKSLEEGQSKPSGLNASNLLHISEAVGFVIAGLPPETQEPALRRFIGMLLERLNVRLEEARNGKPTSPRQWFCYIDTLSAVFSVQNSRGASSVSTAYMQALPGIDAVLTSLPHDETIAEHACRVVKYAVKVGARAADFGFDILHPSLEFLHKHYHLGKHACYLYATSELVKTFSNTRSPKLAALVSEMLQTSCNLLSSAEAVAAYPDVADDTFSLAGRCLAYAPQLLEQGKVLSPLAQGARVAVLVNHKDANIGSILFLQRLLKAISRPSDPDAQWLTGVAREASLSSGKGEALMEKIIAAIAGAVPEDRLEDLGDLLHTLLLVAGQEAVVWAGAILEKVPSISANKYECRQFADCICAGASQKIRVEELMVGVWEFAVLCRRSPRSRDAIMSALLT